MRFLSALYLLAFGLSLNTTIAQTTCLHDYLYPVSESAVNLWQSRKAKCEQYSQALPQYRNDDIYTVKVVVHVLYNNPSENLPDSLIHGQIAMLNRDFRALNPDSYDVRPVFADRVGDAGITFELETILRKPLDITLTEGYGGLPFYDAVKVDSLGGSSPWDANHYLNIWLIHIPLTTVLGSSTRVYGYATLPDSLQHYPPYLGGYLFEEAYIPGVVVDVATVSDGTPRYDSLDDRSFNGRILTHEVGHFLGLLHTFDSVIDIISGSSCGEADGISDTPPQASPTTGCLGANTCFNDIPDDPDMSENHMDYADDQCRVAFTQQQVLVMRGVLENERSGLITPLSGTDPSTADDEHPWAVRVSPNPVRDYFTLPSKLPWHKAKLYDATGRFLQEYQNDQLLSLINYPPGYYVISVFNKESRQLGAAFLLKGW